MKDYNEESITPNETDVEEKTSEEIKLDEALSDENLLELDDDYSKEVKTAVAQKQYWRDKFDKQAQELDSLQAQLKKFQPKETPKQESPKSGEADRLAALELKVDNSHLTMEQINMAMKYATVEGKKPQEIINSPYFQAMVGEESRENRVEGAITNSTNRTGTGNLSFEKIASDESGELYRNLTPENKGKFREYLSKDGGGGLKFMKR